MKRFARWTINAFVMLALSMPHSPTLAATTDPTRAPAATAIGQDAPDLARQNARNAERMAKAAAQIAQANAQNAKNAAEDERRRRINVWIGVGIWLFVAWIIVDLAVRIRRARRVRLIKRQGLCPGCGYDLRATPDRCPECGRAADTPAARAV